MLDSLLNQHLTMIIETSALMVDIFLFEQLLIVKWVNHRWQLFIEH